MHVVAGVDAVQRRRADGEAGGLLRLVVGGDARVGRLVAARLVVLGDDLVHRHAPSHHGLQKVECVGLQIQPGISKNACNRLRDPAS